MPKESSLLSQIQLENGMTLPAREGRPFCSRRDPVKESALWFESHEKVIRSSPEILVLGLGAGFHILQFAAHQEIQVLELDAGLISFFESREHPMRPKIRYVSAEIETEATVLEFRPAWLGREEEYEKISRRLRASDKESLQKAAEKKDLWILAEALDKSSWPDSLELSVKDIVNLFPFENQTQEAKIWRALRELVI